MAGHQCPSSDRIARDIDVLSGSEYTASVNAIRRHAYLEAYRKTLDYFRREFELLGFSVSEDAVGNFVARNRPRGTRVFGLGSHCDSNRNGGRYDGTLGVVTALEVCRLNEERHLGLPLQVISFLEEEGSGFGEMLLGSRIVAQHVTEEQLRSVRAIDDGRAFFDLAREAGLEPEQWRECSHILDDLVAWIEVHIEQGRVLQDAGRTIGLVTAIAGYVHTDVQITGREGHAGATPMKARSDAGTVAAHVVTEVDHLAREAGDGTVGTVGSIEFWPGLRNVIPGKARLTLDIRGTNEQKFRGVAAASIDYARAAARSRGATVEALELQSAPPTIMDRQVLAGLEGAVRSTGIPYTMMTSGAAHDTMLVAERVPSAMVFVPCLDGISHSPLEEARPSDAALATEVVLRAISGLLPSADRSGVCE